MPLAYWLLLTGYSAVAQDVLIVDEEHMAPEGSVLLGNIKIWDGGLKFNCSYNTVMQDARTRALEMGGNIVKITTLKAPDAWSTCYRLKAEIYLSDKLSAMAMPSAYEDSVKRSLIPQGANYSYLYIYSAGSMSMRYKLYDETGNVVCTVGPNSIHKIKVSQAGRMVLSAKTEVERTVSIDIQPGELYYLRCDASLGVVAGRPELDQVSTRLGTAELSYMIEDRKKIEEQKPDYSDDIYK